MQKTKTKIITALLLSLLTLAIFPLSAFASTGFILINTATGPSMVGQTVQAGANVSLYFGGVGFSGGQFYLYISDDGLSQISAGDQRYTVIFDLAGLSAATPTQYPGTTQFPGGWTIGENWVNGTIKQDIAGGNKFIKAFDGTSTSVAVTDTYVTIIANVFIAPTSGAAGQSLTLSGYAFPANSLVNLSYSSLSLGTGSLATLVQTGAIGDFSYVFNAPDTKLQLPAGQQTIASEAITFSVVENKTGATYTAIFNEFARGLAQVRVTGTGGAQQNAAAGTLFGNGTTFTATGTNPLAGVGVNKVLRIAGNYFYPGSLVTRWDNAVVENTAPTINATGWFNTTLTVPPAGLGDHNITLTDGNGTVFVLYVTVVQSITLAPTTGPVGTTVTVSGYGFPSSVGTNVYNVTITFGTSPTIRGWGVTDANGQFTATFNVPSGPGGANTVTATANDTLLTSATATFTITVSFTVTPSTFNNSASLLVVASGTGFKPNGVYVPNIDNQMLGFNPLAGNPPVSWQTGISPTSVGALSFSFIGAGFSVGQHVVSIYENGTSVPVAYAGFNVTGDALSSTEVLTQINSTVNNISKNLADLNATIISINGTVATIRTNVGTMQTSLTSLGTTITSISNGMATLQTSMGQVTTSVNSLAGQIGGISSISSGVASIQTTLGTVTSSLTSLNAKLDGVAGDTAEISTSLGTVTTSLGSIGTSVTSIEGDVATIDTDLGTLTGTVDSIEGDVATISTDIGTMKADISGLKTDVDAVQADVSSTKTTSESLSPLIIVAIVLALIAAIAAIASIVLVRRKIAG